MMLGSPALGQIPHHIARLGVACPSGQKGFVCILDSPRPGLPRKPRPRPQDPRFRPRRRGNQYRQRAQRRSNPFHRPPPLPSLSRHAKPLKRLPSPVDRASTGSRRSARPDSPAVGSHTQDPVFRKPLPRIPHRHGEPITDAPRGARVLFFERPRDVAAGSSIDSRGRRCSGRPMGRQGFHSYGFSRRRDPTGGFNISARQPSAFAPPRSAPSACVARHAPCRFRVRTADLRRGGVWTPSRLP